MRTSYICSDSGVIWSSKLHRKVDLNISVNPQSLPGVEEEMLKAHRQENQINMPVQVIDAGSIVLCTEVWHWHCKIHKVSWDRYIVYQPYFVMLESSSFTSNLNVFPTQKNTHTCNFNNVCVRLSRTVTILVVQLQLYLLRTWSLHLGFEIVPFAYGWSCPFTIFLNILVLVIGYI